MVMTPWGDSASLRERRLPPGPGGAREEVERNQRERLFGAMVASVSSKGYEATTVADLAALSGVSSRSFYDLFGDKRACLLATLEAVIGLAVGVTGAVVVDEQLGGWEERARAGLRSFSELIAAQSAAARVCMIEAYAAGPEVMAPIENAIAGFEYLIQQMVAESPERAGMPAEMISAHIGAIEEIARMRLLADRQDELPALVEELWDLFATYRPPPRPLRSATRRSRPQVESLDAHDHAERALRAFAVVVSERGYRETTVEQVVKRARMSATTFYANFRSKEDAMLAAIDSAGAQMTAAMTPAIRRADDWTTAIRAAIAAVFNFLASRPALAQLLAVEAYAAGPVAMERRVEYLHPFEQLLAEGRERNPEAPAIAVELVAGVLYALAYRRIRATGPQALPSLTPVCTYLALSPFIGPEKACDVANESGTRSRS